VKLSSIKIKNFIVPFKQPFTYSGGEFIERNGIIIYGSDGKHTGIGEASPLPGFSNESLDEVIHVCNHFIDFALNREIALKDLLHHIRTIFTPIPSAQFGLETMVLDLVSKSKKTSISQYLNSDAFDDVNLNGIAGYHSPKDGFTTLKMKVGTSTIEKDIEKIQQFEHEFGTQTKLRLDANECFSFDKAKEFCDKVQHFNIDYIEQPLSKRSLLELSKLSKVTDISIAVDESLTDFESAKRIIKQKSADVFIIKPTLLGGFYESSRVIKLAKQHDIRTVITSSLESPIGLNACAELVKANQIVEACGLTTGILFDINSISYVD